MSELKISFTITNIYLEEYKINLQEELLLISHNVLDSTNRFNARSHYYIFSNIPYEKFIIFNKIKKKKIVSNMIWSILTFDKL